MSIDLIKYRNYTLCKLIFGAKICTDICPRTLSVPRSEQFSESDAIVLIILQIFFLQGRISGDLFLIAF